MWLCIRGGMGGAPVGHEPERPQSISSNGGSCSSRRRSCSDVGTPLSSCGCPPQGFNTGSAVVGPSAPQPAEQVPPELQADYLALRNFEALGDWKMAVRLIAKLRKQGMVPTAHMYNCAMRACMRGRQELQALPLLQEMWRVGPEPDKITYSIVLGALAQTGKYPPEVVQSEWSLYVLEEAARRGQKMPPWAYNQALLTCRWGQWERAMWLLDRMRREGPQPTQTSCSIALTACCRSTQAEQAALLLRDVEASTAEPSVFLYEAALQVCQAGQLWERATILLHDCEGKGLQLTSEMCSSAATTCSNLSRWQHANDLLFNALAVNMKPHLVAELSTQIAAQCLEDPT